MWPWHHMLRACLRRKRRNLIKASRSFVAGDKSRSCCSCQRCQPPDLCFRHPFRLFGSYFTKPCVRNVKERHGDITSHPSSPIHAASLLHCLLRRCGVVTLPASWCWRTPGRPSGRGRGRGWIGYLWKWTWIGSPCSPSGPSWDSCATVPADPPAVPSEKKGDVAAGGYWCRWPCQLPAGNNVSKVVDFMQDYWDSGWSRIIEKQTKIDFKIWQEKKRARLCRGNWQIIW